MQLEEKLRELDLADPLAALREEFALPEGIVYLDGNSLGARPRASLARATQMIEQEWGEGLICSWNTAQWSTLSTRLGDKLAKLIGADQGEVAVTDTTTVNLFKTLAAGLRVQAKRAPQRKVILSELHNFPADLYIIEGLTDLLQQGYELQLIEKPEDLNAKLNDQVALVLLTHVNYKSGHMYDMAATTELIHQNGALALWDLAHSAGAVPVELKAAKADYAIGCTYKYLNGGPGAPAFVWVSPELCDATWQPLSGWWGHARQFAMAPNYEPASGIARYLCGTQPLVSLGMVECGLDIFAKTDIPALRRKSLALTDLFIELVESQCAHHPLTLVTPRNHAERGSHVSFEHPHGYAIVQALIAKGVIGDYREPMIMRFGFTPLYTSFQDVGTAVKALLDVLDNETWRNPQYQTRRAVT
ncbi:kynureninase [Pseudomonas sp. NPDC008258]|uniref:kynureninase n=1 Tax=Pseudomonas sp. NPDC008258 TaxID=3364418 RepID=UPI0036EB384F